MRVRSRWRVGQHRPGAVGCKAAAIGTASCLDGGGGGGGGGGGVRSDGTFASSARSCSPPAAFRLRFRPTNRTRVCAAAAARACLDGRGSGGARHGVCWRWRRRRQPRRYLIATKDQPALQELLREQLQRVHRCVVLRLSHCPSKGVGKCFPHLWPLTERRRRPRVVVVVAPGRLLLGQRRRWWRLRAAAQKVPFEVHLEVARRQWCQWPEARSAARCDRVLKVTNGLLEFAGCPAR